MRGTSDLFVHLVTYNSARFINAAVTSLLRSEVPGGMTVQVTDNASLDDTPTVLEQFRGRVALYRNECNLGFCGAHNQAVARFLKSPARYFVMVNPDLAVRTDTFAELIAALERSGAGMATPLILRADEGLRPLEPAKVDAAGMLLTTSLRHFDRWAGEPLEGLPLREERVFGGTGACLMVTRACVERLLLDTPDERELVFQIYPQLAEGWEERAPLFDEAFFAYREDADLAWRARLLGIDCLFVPQARAFHVRRVTPEQRQSLPAELNAWSVRNRFLLQLNNLLSIPSLPVLLLGVVLRNALVVAGVLIRERTSLRAFRELRILLPRALARRRALSAQIATPHPAASDLDGEAHPRRA